jgi:hypothetical protein
MGDGSQKFENRVRNVKILKKNIVPLNVFAEVTFLLDKKF